MKEIKTGFLRGIGFGIAYIIFLLLKNIINFNIIFMNKNLALLILCILILIYLVYKIIK